MEKKINRFLVLSLILGANSFSEFLVSAETHSRISRHDTELVNKLELEAQVIEAERQLQKAVTADEQARCHT